MRLSAASIGDEASPILPANSGQPSSDLPKNHAGTSAASVANSQQFLDHVVTSLRPWLSIIALLWGLGVSVLGLRLMHGWWRIHRLKQSGREVTDGALYTILLMAAENLGVRRSVRLMVTDWIESPVVVGAMRSVILVPTSFLTGVSPDHIEAILLHELAHIRRYDYLVNLVQSIIETVFFYHPAIWWVSQRIRIERENCCDDLASAAMASPILYGKALVAMEELRAQHLSPAIGARDGVLISRIRRLIGQPVGHDSIASSGPIVATLALAFSLGIFACVATLWADTPANDARFVARIDDQLSVELLAVLPHNGTHSQAWKPDGTKFEEIPSLPDLPSYARTKALSGVDLVLKYTGLASGMIPPCHIDGARSVWNPGQSGFSAVTATPNQDASIGQLTIGIPDQEFGPWQKVDANGKLIESVIIGPRFQQAYHTIQIHDAQPRTASVYLRWANDRDEDKLAIREVVAVSRLGVRHRDTAVTLWDDEDGALHHVDVFDLPLSQIDHFEYRLRPIRHWVTFGNVALKPGESTNTSIEQNEVAFQQASPSKAVFRGQITLADGSPATSKGWMYMDAKSHDGSYIGTIGQFQDQFDFESQTGSVHVFYFPDGYAPVWTKQMELKPGDIVEGLRFELQPGFDLPLEILDHADKPVPQAIVVAHPVIHGKSCGPVHQHPVDDQGRVTLSHLADTSYTFRVEAPGYETLRTDPMKVAPTQPVTLVLHKAASTTGKVLNEDSEPAVGAKLRAKLEIRADGSTNFIYGEGDDSFLGKVVATTDENGRFSLNELSKGSRYLFVIEGADESRLLYRDFQAGQNNLELRLPQRRDLTIDLRGKLDEYFRPEDRKTVRLQQRFSIETSNGNAGDLTGTQVAIQNNASGGTVDYRGLIVDPEVGFKDQIVEARLGTLKPITREFRLSDRPVSTYTWMVGPIPKVTVQYPHATKTHFKNNSDPLSGFLVHSEEHVHWTVVHEGFLQSGMNYNQWGETPNSHLVWKFAGNINAFSGKRSLVEGKTEWEHKRSYPIEFQYEPPNLNLTLDGKQYDLERGRVLVLRESGDPVQLSLTPPSPSQLGDKVRMAKFMDEVIDELASRPQG